MHEMLIIVCSKNRCLWFEVKFLCENRINSI